MTRHLAIGDIHGCYKALETLANQVGFRSDDTIITLGDYVNRGPDSRKVIDWLIRIDRTHTLVPLRGNHDVMMIAAAENPESHQQWFKYRGEVTLKSYARKGKRGSLADVPDAHWDFLRHRLRSYHETDRHIFVHATVDPDLPLDEQPDFVLFWEKISDPAPHVSGKVVVCGHTSQKSGMPLSVGNTVCIDTWACGDGWLSCLDVDSGQIWQANQKGKTREFVLGTSRS